MFAPMCGKIKGHDGLCRGEDIRDPDRLGYVGSRSIMREWSRETAFFPFSPKPKSPELLAFEAHHDACDSCQATARKNEGKPITEWGAGRCFIARDLARKVGDRTQGPMEYFGPIHENNVVSLGQEQQKTRGMGR